MIGIRTVIGSFSALMIIFGILAAKTATAQDQPIKRTELHRSDLADVVGKEAVIYIADVMPGAEGGGIPIMGMSTSMCLKARLL